MSKDTDEHIVIGRSLLKLFGLVVGGVVFVAIGVWMIQGGGADSSRGAPPAFLGWLCAVFFGLATVVGIFRAIFGPRKPLELSPYGFWDKRVFDREVPWSSVVRISIWSHRGTSILIVKLTDEAMQGIKRPKMNFVARWMNKPFGIDGISIVTGDLAISFSEFVSLFQKYLAKYNPEATDDTKS